MPAPPPNQFWTLVGESGLVDADRLAALRSEFEIESLSPAATPEAVTEVIAKWLVRRKVLTLWQVRRIVRGDRGPFFIGDYRLLERLEKDAYQGRSKGHLFRARHEPSGRVVLLMVLDTERCRDLEVWTDIVRRTTIANRTADPTLARTWALEQSGGQRFIVCEDVGGTSLTAELAARGPRAVAEAGPIVLAMARAVAELHRLGVVHGGISLEALKREPVAEAEPATGRVRLLQFPLVADPHVVPPQPVIDTPEGVRGMGTRVAFLAPELLLPGAVCDPRSDVYAIGCVLHALLAGALPCWQGDAERTLAQAAFVGPPPLGPPQVPVEVATLVSYLVARDPAARYQSAAEAADAIAACLGLPPVSPSLPAQQPFIGPAAAAAPEPPVAAPSPAAAVLSASRAAEPAVIVTPAAPPPQTKQTGSRWIVASLGLAALAATAAGLFMAVGTRTPVTVPKPPSRAAKGESVAVADRPRVEQPPEAEPVSAAEPEEPAQSRPFLRLVDAADVPNVPWASPTSGLPPMLAHLPPGSQLVLLARPADLLASTEGSLLVKALGDRAEQALAALAAACGCAVEEIELVQAGWQADLAAGPDAVAMGYAVRGTRAFPVADDEAARDQAWGKTTPQQVDGETIHVGPSLSYWLPDADGGSILVAAPEKLLREIVAADAAGREREKAVDWRDRLQATLPPDLEELVGMLDEDRHLTVFGSPAYLLHDGRPVFAGPLAKLVEPLNAVLGEGSAAAALSLHCGDTFYLELDAIPGRSSAARGEAAALADRIAAIADTVEAYCNALDPHPHGQKVVRRLPGMVRILAANLRTAAEGKGVVVNCHLPRQAGHNLALAGELAVEQTPGAVAVAQTPASASQSAMERLAKRISLTFARDTLEKSIQMLSEEIGMPIEILGRDLELEGITKNQSFGLDEQDQPAEAILGAILARSNPDGKLVYVVRRRDGAESIEITTRAAAEKRGDDLPAMFATGPQAAQEEENPK